MLSFEIRINVEEEEIILRQSLVLAVKEVIKSHYPNLTCDDISIVDNEDRDFQTSLPRRINELEGRSRLIAMYLYDNPGDHSTQDLNDLIGRELPFKRQSILHSYLNNLISRRFVVKSSPGFYRSTRKT